jgi:hypothetical protein
VIARSLRRQHRQAAGLAAPPLGSGHGRPLELAVAIFIPSGVKVTIKYGSPSFGGS